MRRNGLAAVVAGAGTFAVLTVLFAWFLAAGVRGDHVGREASRIIAGTGVASELPDGRAASAVHYSDRVAVLMYHHLQEEPESGDILSPRQLERQMELLAEHGFEVIGAEEYAAFALEGAKVPDNAVLLTFDDGYASFYELAYPVLKRFGYPAIGFVIVSGIDQRDKPGIPKLTWDQMREMQRDGIAFMNHTYDLHAKKADASGKEVPLTDRQYLEDKDRSETAEEYRKRVLDHLLLAEKRLSEELGNELKMLAFPYGYYTEDLVRIAREAGMEIMFSVKHGLASRKNEVAPRVNAGRSDMEPEEVIRILKALGRDGM